jgi:endonuclease/exonuclease/phosphatase family metal-dependent hydrolase
MSTFVDNYLLRDYSKDFARFDDTQRPDLFSSQDIKGQCRRVASAIYPVLTLFPQFFQTINLAGGLSRSFDYAYQISKNNNLDIRNHLRGLSNCASLFCTIMQQHTLALTLSTSVDTLQELPQVISAGDLSKISDIAGRLLYLSALVYFQLEFQVGFLCMQSLIHGYQAIKEYKNGYLLETATNALVATARTAQFAKGCQLLTIKHELEPIVSKVAWNILKLSHYASEYLHKLTYSIYQISQEGLQGTVQEKLSTLANMTLQAVASPFLLLSSVFLSSMGALSIWLTGRDFLLIESDEISEEALNETLKVLSYNIGQLPGELAVALTVGTLEDISYEEKKELLAQFIAEQYQNSDLIVLQEAVDFKTLDHIKTALDSLSLPYHFYLRIGNPLDPGIASGLAAISKNALSDFTVEKLPESNLLFNRSFASFVHPSGHRFVISHLASGNDDEVRQRQWNTIMDKFPDSDFYSIGDFNFSDDFPIQMADSRSLHTYINSPTTIDGDHPDFVGFVGENPPSTEVSIMDDVNLSDHYPVSIEISNTPKESRA